MVGAAGVLACALASPMTSMRHSRASPAVGSSLARLSILVMDSLTQQHR